jgi:hypothetical protein
VLSIRRHCDCLFAIAFLLSATCTYAQDSLNVRKIGAVSDYWDSATDVAVVDSVAYVATSSTGLRVVNIADPGHPDELSGLHMRTTAGTLAASGHRVYFVDNQNVLQIVDVSNPAVPIVVGHFAPTSVIYAVKTEGTRVYLLTALGILIVETSTPAFPSVLGSYFIENPTGSFALQGDLIYVLNESTGGCVLHIVDASDPSAPVEAGMYAAEPHSYHVAVAGSFASLTSSGGPVGRLTIVDISDTASPNLVGFTYVGHELGSVVVEDSVAYVMGQPYGPVYIFSIADPAQPRYLAEFRLYDQAGFVVNRRMIFLAEGYHGLRIFDASGTGLPVDIGGFQTGHAAAVAVQGDYAYVANLVPGLRVVAVSQPSAPDVVGASGGSWGGSRVVVRGSLAYFNDLFDGFRIVDISNPLAPAEVAQIDTLGLVSGLDVQGDYLYLASDGYGLVTMNVSNPMSPVTLSTIGLLGEVSDVSVENDIGCVGLRHGVEIVSVTVTEAPVVLGQIDLGLRSVWRVLLRGQYAFAAGSGGVCIVDISNPEAPELVCCIAADSIVDDLALEGGHLFCTVLGVGMRVYDISDTAHPVETGRYLTRRQSMGIAVRDGIAYLADFSEFGIYDCSAALGVNSDVPRVTSFALSPAYPNPFNSSTQFQFELPRAVTGKITVYDLLGRDVRTLFSGQLAAGPHTLSFDATGLASGEYFLRVDAPPFARSMKVTLIK